MKKLLSIALLVIFILFGSACAVAKSADAVVYNGNPESNIEDGKYDLERSGDAGENTEDNCPAEIASYGQKSVVEIDIKEASFCAETLIFASFSQHSYQTLDDDGDKIFICQYAKPEFVTEDEELNAWLASKVDSSAQETSQQVRNLEQQAMRDSLSREEDGLSFYTYSYYSSVSTERMDNSVLSILQINSVYSGGAHPLYAQVAYNLDLDNQVVLTLADVILSGSHEQLQQILLERLSQRFGGLENSGLFTDYPDIIKSSFEAPGLTANWYFTGTGLVIYFNCYDIAPYAAGIIKVEFPYDSLTGILRSEYFPDAVLAGEGSAVLLASGEGRRVLNTEETEDHYYIGPERSLFDVKLYQINGWITEDMPIMGPMVFAANALTANQALSLSPDVPYGYLLTAKSGEGQTRKLVIDPIEIREIVGEIAE